MASITLFSIYICYKYFADKMYYVVTGYFFLLGMSKFIKLKVTKYSRNRCCHNHSRADDRSKTEIYFSWIVRRR